MWTWNGSREQAAQLLASGELSHQQVAEKVGINKATITRWLKIDEFRARVDSITAEVRKVALEDALRIGVADIRERVRRLDETVRKLEQIRLARAGSTDMAAVPGGETGLVLRQHRSIGFGQNNQIIQEYAVDTGWLREYREYLKQAAIELGQWVDRHAVGGTGDSPIEIAGMQLGQDSTPEQLEAQRVRMLEEIRRTEAAEKAAAAKPAAPEATK